MNKIYSTVWNKSLGQLVVASELACSGGRAASKGDGRSASGLLAFKAVVSAMLLAGCLIWTDAAMAASVNCNYNAGDGTQVVCTSGTVSGTGAIGVGSGTASGNGAVALGSGTSAFGDQSTALGSGAQAAISGSGSQSTAIGAFVGALGDQSTALGNNAQAQGNSSIAIGGDDLNKVAGATYTATVNGASFTGTGAAIFTQLTGSKAIASGTYYSPAAGDASIALGPQARAGYTGAPIEPKANAGSQTGEFDIAIGAQAYAAGFSSIALGTGAMASADASFAIGPNANASGNASMAYGISAIASQANAVAIGTGGTSKATYTQATGAGATAIGGNATAGAIAAASDAVAIGGQSKVATGATSGVAIGLAATANSANDVALGAGSVTPTTGQHTGTFTINGSTPGGLTSGAAVVSVGKAGAERQIQNVAPGVLDSTSTDVVNGSQLFATNQQVNANTSNLATNDANLAELGTTTATALGANATYSAANGITGFSQPINTVSATGAVSSGQTNETSVGAALTQLNANVDNVAAVATKGWNLQANGGTATNVLPGGTVNVANGSNIAVTQSGSTLTIATSTTPTFTSVTTGSGSNTTVMNGNGVTVNGGNNRVALIDTGLNNGGNKITNVANGSVASGSTDAVNGGQLYVVQQAANAGWTATADNKGGNATSASQQITPNGKVDFTNGGDSNLSVSQTSSTANQATIQVQLAKNLDLGSGGSVTTGGTVVDSDGMSIGSGASQVSLGSGGLNNGGNAIKGVADGTVASGSTEAVNGGQLYTVATTLGSALAAAATHYYSVNDGGTKDGNYDNNGATGQNALAAGVGATATGPAATAVGHGATAADSNDTAIGGSAKTTFGGGNTAVGYNAHAGSSGYGNDTALGNNASATGGNSAALGNNTYAAGNASVAIGSNASAQNANDVALGAGSVTATPHMGTTATQVTLNGTTTTFAGPASVAAGVVSVGSNGKERQIQNVAAGELSAVSTDAVNGSQLYATNQALTAVAATANNAVQYDNAGKTSVTLGGATSTDGGVTNGTTITNLHQGAVTATSTDAVNGGQLYSVQQIANNANQGWKVTTSAMGSGVAKDTSTTTVAPGDTATITAGNNVITTQNGADVAIGVNPELTGLTSVALTGGPTINSTGIHNLADGTAPTDAATVGQVNTAANKWITGNPPTYTAPTAKGANSMAIGSGAVANGLGDVALGSGTTSHGADATTNYTAANAVVNGSTFTVNQAPTNGAVAVGERQITQVADGEVSATSTDAVNGSQLYNVGQALDAKATALGNSVASSMSSASSYNAATGVLTTKLSVGGTDYGSVQDALDHISTTAGAGWNLSANGGSANASSVNIKPGATVDVSPGSSGNITVAQNATNGNLTIDTNPNLTATSVTTGNTVLSNAGVTVSGGTNGPVSLGKGGLDNGGNTITNVGAGTLSASSRDAVNGSQLYATNQIVGNQGISTASVLGGNASYDTATGTLTISDIGGTGQNTVDGAISAIKTTANKGWNVTTAAVAGSSGVANGSSVAAVKPGDTATIAAGDNIITTQKGADVAIGVNPVLTGLTSVTAGNSMLDTNGLAVNDGTNSATYGSTGMSIANGPSVTVAGIDAGNKTITNVADGNVAAGSTDAVNGGQLYATNQSIDNIANGKAGAFQSDNSVTAAQPVASGANATAGGFGASATGGNSTVVGNDATDNGVANSTVLGQGASIAAGTTGSNVALGQGSTVASAAIPTASGTINGSTYKYAGGTPAGVVSVGSAGNERQVTNVAAGQVTATSTDAVNGSQLYATNQAVTAVGTAATNLGNSTAEALGGGSSYDPATGQLTTSLDVGGHTYTNVNDALNAISTTASSGWSITTAATGTGVANGSSVAKVTPGTTATITAGNNIVTTQSGTDVAIGVNPVLTGMTSVTTTDGKGGSAVMNGGGVTVSNGSGSTTYGADGMTIANGPSVTTAGVDAGGKQITNVAAGTAANDAATVGQVQAAQAGSVKYDTNADGSINYDSITLNPNGSAAQIHNVAPGTSATDAANVGQVQQGMQAVQNWSKSYTDQAVNNLGNKAFAGVAAAIATASLPQAYQPNQSSAGVGLGNFHGESAISVGVSTISESGRWIFKANASTGTRGDTGVGVGAGIVW